MNNKKQAEKTETKLPATGTDMKKRMLDSACMMLFFVMTVVIFGPIEVFMANYQNYSFGPVDFWWILVSFGLVVWATGTVFLTVLPEKLSAFFQALVFAGTLACYLQAMFLNGQMKMMTGQKIQWSSALKIGNLVFWLGLFLIVLVIRVKDLKIASWFKWIALALTAMQLTALISFIFTEAWSDTAGGYLSDQYAFELSENRNTVIFIVDSFDGRFMEQRLEKEPEFLDELAGFTYFQNATSGYSRTYPSLPYILTGADFRFDKEPATLIQDAYDNCDLFETMQSENVQIGFFAPLHYVSADRRDMIANYKACKVKLSYKDTVQLLVKTLLYRDAPYFCKDRFEYNVSDMELRMVKTEAQDAFSPFNDAYLQRLLVEHPVQKSISEDAFRIYHLEASHATLETREMGEDRAFGIINSYLEQMKELGIYKDATIIIMADHAAFYSGAEYIPAAAVPVILVKPAGADTGPVVCNTAPVAQSEVLPTVKKSFGLETEQRDFFSYSEGEQRDRLYYYTGLTSDEEEVELYEVLVDGDARDPASYHATGNTWPILYSRNKVKAH